MNTPTRCTRRDFLNRMAQGGAALCGIAASSSAFAAQTTDSPWQIGCYTRPWGRQDYRVALDAIAEAGYRHAGIMTGHVEGQAGGLIISYQTDLEIATAVGEACRERGLIVPSLYGGDSPVSESLEAGIAGMRSLIDNCEAVGAANLMMGGTGDAELQPLYYKAVAETCAYAAEKGVGISVKPHGGLNATGPQCRDIVNGVNHDNFRVWYDPGNIFFYSDGELDPVDDLASVDGLVVGVCIKDYEHPKKVDVAPGDGLVDFPAVLKGLKRGGFTGGPLVVETLAPGDAQETIQAAIRARLFVEEIIADLNNAV